MPIQFACPYCDQISSVPDSFAGKTGKCPSCAKVIEVPDPNAGVEAAAGPETVPPPSKEKGDKPCPFCGETIKSVAKKCKFCGEFLDKGAKRQHRSGGPRPENHMTLAIVATVATFLCGICWPMGIVSIVMAAQVDSKHRMGDEVGARQAATWAKRLAWWAMGINFGIIALYIVIVIIANM